MQRTYRVGLCASIEHIRVIILTLNMYLTIRKDELLAKSLVRKRQDKESYNTKQNKNAILIFSFKYKINKKHPEMGVFCFEYSS